MSETFKRFVKLFDAYYNYKVEETEVEWFVVPITHYYRLFHEDFKP